MTNKQSDPWDDSALLNAFDEAIIKYKKMHKKERRDSSKVVGGENSVVGSSTQPFTIPVVADETPPPTSTSTSIPTIITSSKNAGNANDPSVIEENHQIQSHSQESDKQTSSGAHMQDVYESSTNSQGVDECAELLKQYYELEEQRQKVLEQLQQTGYWNYQHSGDASGPSGQYSSEEYQNFNQHASHPTAVSYCCPCVCPYLVTPCSSMPSCSLPGACLGKKDIESTSTACAEGPESLHPLEGDNMVKSAMGAAQRAIASISLNASTTAETTNAVSGFPEGHVAQNGSSETDLAVVLNAWYSAGFYTGRYLLEQSISKGRQ